MSSSLRDQLLKAGLVNEQQVRQTEKRLRKQPRSKKNAPTSAQQQAEQARAEKAARDRELNRKNKEKAEAKARAAEVRQLIDQHRLPSCQDGEPHHFQDGKHIKRIYVDAEQRGTLVKGELVIARYGRGFALLPPSAAERVRERDPGSIVDLDAGAGSASADEDDAYKGFEVPDNLMW